MWRTKLGRSETWLTLCKDILVLCGLYALSLFGIVALSMLGAHLHVSLMFYVFGIGLAILAWITAAIGNAMVIRETNPTLVLNNTEESKNAEQQKIDRRFTEIMRKEFRYDIDSQK